MPSADTTQTMGGDRAAGDPERTAPQNPTEQVDPDRRKAGLDDPRALQILTTEHWSLLSTRALGYQEMFGRTTIFVAALSGTIVALALVAQATHFGPQALSFGLVLISVALLIGIATFARCVAINYEDARWVTGMNLLRHAYLQIVPELEPFFLTGHQPDADRRSLAHGSSQRLANLANSLTTTSSIVAALNSVLAGSLASDLGALLGAGLVGVVVIGAGVSLLSAAVHIRGAARFRQTHLPSTR
jgi:type III secretory pathway component EscS